MIIHIATVGLTVVPITKVLNKISGIDRLFLIYGLPPDGSSSFGNVNVSDLGNKSVRSFENKMENISTGPLTGRFDSSKETCEYIRDSFKMAIPFIEMRPVPMFDFMRIVKEIYSIYDSYKGKGVEFSINITGGTNLMASAACYSSYYIHAKIFYATMTGGSIGDEVMEIQSPKAVDFDSYKAGTKRILTFINDKSPVGTTNAELSSYFGLSKQTIGYSIKILKNDGLIKEMPFINDEGKVLNNRKRIVITDNGSIIASYI